MKVVFCIFVFLFSLISNSYAQVYGFMGKRFSIGASVHLSPNLFKRDISSIDGSNINSRFSLEVDYVLTNKWSVSSTVYLLNSATNKLTFDDPLETDDNKNLPYKINSNGFTLSFSRFLTNKNDFIAPVGKYISFGLHINNYTLVDVKGHVYEPQSKVSSASVAGFSLGLGRKRVFYRRIIFNYGLEASYLFYSRPFKGDSNLEELVSVPKKRIRQVSLLNLKASIGYLF